MLQLVRYRSWNAAGAAKTIDINAIERGVRLAQEELEERVFDATIAELSKGDRAFLQAMTLDEELTYRSDLTQRLNKSSGIFPPIRNAYLRLALLKSLNPVFSVLPYLVLENIFCRKLIRLSFK